MSTERPRQQDVIPAGTILPEVTRRSFFRRMGGGLAGAALAELVAGEAIRAAAADEHSAAARPRRVDDLAPRPPHHPPRAEAVIHLFMHGGPSQMDLLDYKPALEKYDGKGFPGVIDVQQPEQAGGVLKSPFKFARYGEVGLTVSELLPHTAGHVDDLAVIQSMWTEHINHEPALWMFHTGRTVPGRPAMASWITYGLGAESHNLPAFVVLDDPRGLPVDGIRNWSSGWLPPLYQGTRMRATGTPVWNLAPFRKVPVPLQRSRRALLLALDRRHRELRPGEPELDARIASYQLAARMQLSAAEALDLSQETRATQELYGLGNKTTEDYGRRCLLARRLVERGVRYVQLMINGQIWDNHANLANAIRSACDRTDQPTAALLTDLKQRGLLDKTLVIWGGEFGRLPISQSKNGRDHNRQGFTTWLAGGGVKAGTIYGATDEFGYAAVENRVSVPDFHATVLHLLGLDHKQLVYYRNGLEERLTGVNEPRVVEEILA